jgi:WD40 repeat protein
MAFSPDGKALAAGYGTVGGGGVVVWDVAARHRLAEAPLPVEEDCVESVAFSPDGKALAAGAGDSSGRGSSVVVWDMDFESWKRRAARIANRNFSRDEWRQYLPDEPYRPTFPELPVPPEVTRSDEAASTARSR